eukprot:355791-Chlamydomonas_euryale.AAC.16
MQSLRTKVNGSSAVAGRRGVAVPARATVRHAAASEQLNAAASSTSSSGASVAVSGVKAAALAAAAASLVIASPAYAAEVVNTVAMDGGSATAAVGGLGAIAGLGALLIATDPQKRCATRLQFTRRVYRARGRPRTPASDEPQRYSMHTESFKQAIIRARTHASERASKRGGHDADVPVCV